MTVSHQDSKLSRLLDSSGLAGYGAWWLVLEIIAGEMGKEDQKCSVEHSLTRWSRFLCCHSNKVKVYLMSMQSAGLVDLEIIEGRYRVSVPNLLKYRDEYSKKSGHALESVRTISLQSRAEQNSPEQTKPDQSVSSVCSMNHKKLVSGEKGMGSENEKLTPLSQTVLQIMNHYEDAGFPKT